MPTVRRVFPSIIAALAALSVAGVFVFRRFDFGYVPLESAGPAAAPNTLPADSVVLNAGEAQTVTAPFRLRGDVGSTAGQIVALPEGHGSTNRQGRAVLELCSAEGGVRHAWTRVRWRDSCGNSVAIGVSNASPFTAGQDAVYGVWHWVKAGTHTLAPGTNMVTLLEREDGVEIDQVVLTPDKRFVPSGSIGNAERKIDQRHFGDDFARSPGHGLQQWTPVSGKWDINFTLDPNRIPNQYSLGATLEERDREAVVLTDGAPWRGCRAAVSFFTPRPARLGILLADGPDTAGEDCLRIEIDAGQRKATLRVTGCGIDATQKISDRVRMEQWHRLVVERWAWILRVLIDEHAVLTECDVPPGMVRPGLFVTEGGVAFDDVMVDEVVWQAEDGGDFRIPWTVREGAKWFRRKPVRKRAPALVGRAGVIATRLAGLPVQEMLVDGANRDGVGKESGLVEADCGNDARLVRLADTGDGHEVYTAGFEAPAGGKVTLRRVAVSYGKTAGAVFRDGPYHFTEPRVPDPSDYLDFTEEEVRAIMQSPEVDKLRRGKKTIPLVGNPVTGSFWAPAEQKRWLVEDGVLTGLGPARLRYWKEIITDVDMRLRIKRMDANSTAELVFYEGLGAGLSVVLGETGMDDSVSGLSLRVPADNNWHDVHIQCRPHSLAAHMGKGEWKRVRVSRGLGGGIVLAIRGGIVHFDDIEMEVPRRSHNSRVYAFDRIETDWWREGEKWVDHGGFSCMVASSWISLVGPHSHGMLWNKQEFGDDVAVSFMVQENSEWFGWKQKPQHLHYPYDNICVILSPKRDFAKGYRLVINTNKRKSTALYRDDVEVMSVPQDANFPIRFSGQHNPYTPRNNQVSLWKQAGKLTAVINGKCVLEYTDPSPLPVRRVGIGGFHTRANFAHIQIREL